MAVVTPQVKTGLTHLGTAAGGFIAAVAFMASHSVDLYAIWDQLNEVVAAIAKLVAMVTPLATAAYDIYRSGTNVRLREVAADPEVKAVIAAPSLAAAVPNVKVQASVSALPDQVQRTI